MAWRYIELRGGQAGRGIPRQAERGRRALKQSHTDTGRYLYENKTGTENIGMQENGTETGRYRDTWTDSHNYKKIGI